MYKVQIDKQLFCITNKPNNLTYLVGDIYTEKCPETHIFTSILPNHDIKCYEKCPNKRYHEPNSTVCVTECDPQFPFMYDSMCLASCPDNVTFIKDNHTCVINCTGDPREKCIPFCPNVIRSRYFNGTCVRTCPVSHSFIIHSDPTCYSQCPTGYVRVENTTQCLNTCPLDAPLKVNDSSVCTIICPKSHIYRLNGVCNSECPEPLHQFCISSECTCIKKCPAEFAFVFNGNCISSCPVRYPFFSDDKKECNDKCPDRLSHVPNRTECIKKCPEIFPFNNDGLCLNKCPEHTPHYNSDKVCGKTCNGRLKINGSNECINNCNNTFPYVEGSTCYFTCPSTYPVFNSNSHCLKVCPLGQKPDESGLCVDVCRNKAVPYIYKDTCVKQCPSDRPFVNDNTCDFTCGTKMIFNETFCCTKCPPKAPYSYKKKCFLRCPKHTKTNRRSVFTDNSCLDQCYYWRNYVYEFNNQTWCVDSCPSSHPFILSDTKTCLKQCPKSWVKRGNLCVKMFPNITFLCVSLFFMLPLIPLGYIWKNVFSKSNTNDDIDSIIAMWEKASI